MQEPDAAPSALPMRLAVLNPGGRDPEQSFAAYAGPVEQTLHPPINYHAYAACTAGTFHRSVSAIPESVLNVLLLLRRDLSPAAKALKQLKKQGKIVAVSFKESGLHQVQTALASPRNIRHFKEICAFADAALASTPDLIPLYRQAGARRVEFVPTPYPVDDPRWNFHSPGAARTGIFIGTREFDVPSRNHLAALFAAAGLSAKCHVPVTVINADGRRGRAMIESAGFPDDRIRVVDGPIPYIDYLRLISRHAIVFQLDRSAVPGQVAGDALLCGTPCVGGDGAVERLAFPACTGHGRDSAEIVDIAERLLRAPADVEATARQAQEIASRELSFRTIAARLREFFARSG